MYNEKTGNIEYKYLMKTLYQMGQEIIALRQQFLIADNKIATGDLVETNDPQNVEYDETSVYIMDKKYGDNVEFGRRVGAKFPPVKKIKKWIKDKGISIPPSMNSDQLAFLISRNISLHGIPAGQELERAMEIIFDQYKDIIDIAIVKDVDQFLLDITVDLEQFDIKK